MSVTHTLEGALSMSVYTVLKGEHAEVRGLIKMLEASMNMVPGEQKTLFHKLYRELISHTRAEQETVYRDISERISAVHIDEAEDEHAKIEEILESLKEMDAQSEAWKASMKILADAVKHHVEEEEGVIFENMKAVFTDEEAKAMAKEFYDAKERHVKMLE